PPVYATCVLGMGDEPPKKYGLRPRGAPPDRISSESTSARTAPASQLNVTARRSAARKRGSIITSRAYDSRACGKTAGSSNPRRPNGRLQRARTGELGLREAALCSAMILDAAAATTA